MYSFKYYNMTFKKKIGNFNTNKTKSIFCLFQYHQDITELYYRKIYKIKYIIIYN